MDRALLVPVSASLETARSVLRTSERLRVASASQARLDSDERNAALASVTENVPDSTEWKVYDHCAAVTRAYAVLGACPSNPARVPEGMFAADGVM